MRKIGPPIEISGTYELTIRVVSHKIRVGIAFIGFDSGQNH